MYGIPAETIADLCKVHVTTARRWKRYGDAPHAALVVVELHTTGNLGAINSDWSNWRLVDGKLIAPDQIEYTQAEIMAGPFWKRLAQAYQSEQKLERQADWVDERWIVNEIEAETG